MRKSSVFFIYLAINFILICLLLVHASFIKKNRMPLLMEKVDMVRRLELTDLALFIEARYTRHLTQADLSTPFQDHPISFEHFPSGSIVGPPSHLKGQ